MFQAIKHQASYQAKHEKVRKNLSSGNRDIDYSIDPCLNLFYSVYFSVFIQCIAYCLHLI
jgi:hypothetical protein